MMKNVIEFPDDKAYLDIETDSLQFAVRLYPINLPNGHYNFNALDGITGNQQQLIFDVNSRIRGVVYMKELAINLKEDEG